MLIIMNSTNRKSITIDDQFYTISSMLLHQTWNILLTNLDDLFIEKLPRVKIVERCERLNPLLSIEDIDVDEIIRELFGNIPKYAVGTSSLHDIKLQTVIDGGTFNFVIHLSRADDREFREKVMKPVISYVVELQQKFYNLIDEIKRKDQEIFEYKASGAELIRKHIETKPFDSTSWIPDTFKEYGDFISKCQSVSHYDQMVGLQKKVKVETIDSPKTMIEGKEITKCHSNKTTEPELTDDRILNFPHDSVDHKKRRNSESNS